MMLILGHMSGCAHLVGHGGINTLLDNLLELVNVVGNATTSTTTGEGRADNQGVATNLASNSQSLLHAVGSARLGHLQANALHRLLEQLAVLGTVNGGQLGTNQLNVILGKQTLLQGALQRGSTMSMGL